MKLKQKKQKHHFISWFFFVFFLLAMLSMLVVKCILSAVCCLFMALLCHPKIWNFITAKIPLKQPVRIVSILILYFIAGSLMPQSIYSENTNLTNTQETGIEQLADMEQSEHIISETTELPVTTEAQTTTQTPTTTEAPTTTQAPTTTEAPTTTQAATTTEAPTTTQAPTTTEAPTTAQTPTTTKVTQAEEAYDAQENTATVWIASSGNGYAYHARSTCGNMKKSTPISLSDAQARGYTPCKKCY